MDEIDRSNIEEFINDPSRCFGLIIPEEFYGCRTPKECPWKQLVKILYKQELEQELEKESGLI